LNLNEREIEREREVGWVAGHGRPVGWVTAKPMGLAVSPALELFFLAFRVTKSLKSLLFISRFYF
jgi:hypothetical protein